MKLLVIAAIFVIASILIVLGLSKKKKEVKPEIKPVVEPVHVKPEPVEVKPEPVIEIVQEPVVEESAKAPAKKKPAVKKVVKNVK